jgi:gliding motility-associated-like protein
MVMAKAPLFGQKVFVNTPDAFYELTGGAGNCSYVPVNNECSPGLPNNPFSMAVYKDTLYYTDGNTLYSFKIGVPGSCRTYAAVGGHNSMTVDINGILYFASNVLVRYNPYTNQLDNLGSIPFSSAGDLVFFNNKLLLAGTPAAIYEINISNPQSSTQYMNTNGIIFYGFISYPVPCGNSRYFGLSPSSGGTAMYELDLASKTIIGNNCDLNNIEVYDAGSTTEGGINAGLNISNFTITHPCPPALTGSISIQAVLAGFNSSYTLNNSITNTTGIFNNVPVGTHTIHVIAGSCILDTIVTIFPGLNPLITVQKSNPNNCNADNGSILLAASSAHLPITYTLHTTGQQQSNGSFTNLSQGNYVFTIKDAAGCTKDTSVTLTAMAPAVFVQSIATNDVHCNSNKGAVLIKIAGDDTSGVLTSLSMGTYVPKVSYHNLAPGTYNIRVKKGSLCFFDTTVIIASLIDPKPQIIIQKKDQYCFTNNGSIKINATVTGFSYQYQINGSGFSNTSNFSNQPPGLYTINIQNQFGCQWDTSTVIMPYNIKPFTTTITTTDPTCKAPFTGSLSVFIKGQQEPYYIILNGSNTYSNSQVIVGLTDQVYNIVVYNSDGCAIDSTSKRLTINYEPSCDNVFVPNGFSPNGDNLNDYFRPNYSYFAKNITMKIFNRLGEIVYSGSGYGIQWDGKFKGVNQTAGGYVYLITYKDYSGTSKKIKGSLLLIR